MINFIGQSLGRYHILERLGEGGMATVYKAYDTRLECEVAVKVIRTEKFTPEVLARALKRFEREAKALARLTHANIVKVNDYGEYEGRPYLVMPYLPGGNLKQLLKERGRLLWQEAVKLLLPILHALDYAHSQNVIHRDVKPSNILITSSGDPMLTDFGVAKILEEEIIVDLTGTAMTVGTPEYMAPEQVSSKGVDHRADIYSLGVVFYEMVTGRRPYEADTPLAVIAMRASEPLPRPSQFVHDFPEAVEKVLLKALAKKPDDRYQSMGLLAHALEDLATGSRVQEAEGKQPRKESRQQEIVQRKPEPALAPSAPPQSANRNRQSKMPWLIGLGLAGLVAVSLFIGWLAGGGPAALFPTRTPAPTITFTPTFMPTTTFTPVITATPRPTSTPSLGIGSTQKSSIDGMVLVYVPAGNFTMGFNSPDAPAHKVNLGNFWIDQTEVTNGMYALCVQAGACQPPSDTSSATRTRYFGNSEFANYPVIYVDWNDAQAYCSWAGRRLPTEAEWEKTARGTDGRTYPWGNEPPTCELTNSFCVGDTAQVGSYPAGASPYDALDMSGNVWQWIADWYDVYPGGDKNVDSNFGQTYRVVRSNGWEDYENGSYFRGGTNPDRKQDDIGFRCARSP
jgi:serine/threonine-protein kinase